MSDSLIKLVRETKDVFLFFIQKIQETKRLRDILDQTYHFIYFSLKKKPAFPICVSINEIFAHGVQKKNTNINICEGDIIRLDIGLLNSKNEKTDFARTYTFKNLQMNCLDLGGQDICIKGSKQLKIKKNEFILSKELNKIRINTKLFFCEELLGHRITKKILHSRPYISFYEDKTLSRRIKVEKGFYCLEIFISKSFFQTKEKTNNCFFISKQNSFFWKAFQSRFFSEQMIFYELGPKEWNKNKIILEKELSEKILSIEPCFTSTKKNILIEHREEMFFINLNNSIVKIS